MILKTQQRQKGGRIMKLIQKMNLKDRILRKQNKRILAGYLAILLTTFGVLPSFAYTQSPNNDETMYHRRR